MRRAPRAFVLGALIAAALSVGNARGDVDRMTFGDGAIHRYVATHLTTPPDAVDPRIEASGTSLRYGRIGLPVMIWLSAAGDPGLMRFTQPALVIGSAGMAVAALSLLMPTAPLGLALVLFLVPAFPLAAMGAFAEVPALALALWGLVFLTRRRWGWAGLALAAATLTKEAAGAALLGAILVGALRRERRATVILAASATIPLVWHLFILVRSGHLPLLDPYLTGESGLNLPGVGLVRSLTHAFSPESFIIAAIHVGLAAVAFALARRSVFGVIGAFASLQLLVASPFTWRFIGDGIRTSAFIEAFVILAAVAAVRPHQMHPWIVPGAVEPERSPAPAGP